MRRNQLLTNAKLQFEKYCPSWGTKKICPISATFGNVYSLDWRDVRVDGPSIDRDQTRENSSGSANRVHLWSIQSGDAKDDLSDPSDDFKDLRFKVAYVEIDRPWLDIRILMSRGWRWKVSPTDPENEKYLDLVILPNQAHLAREAVIQTAISESITKQILNAVDNHIKVFWGPFVCGSILPDNTTRYILAGRSSIGATAYFTQLIALSGNTISFKSDPNPEYIWK